MPHSRSAKKSARKVERRAIRNRAARSALRTAVRKAEAGLASDDQAAATVAVAQAVRALDKAVTKGLVHKSTASRKKSRLSIRLNAGNAQ
ncbi:MAG: 30S ribosomal protein S20 [Chloroflexi bacterium]|nr:30S ribosomal protein S20 [Chloroflexota bacterium]